MSFGPPPAPANDLPPADDPPEETYEDCPWAGGGGGDEDGIDDDRADGAEHDWLYQRRNGYDDIYDPWAPDEVEERRQSRLEREDREEEARRGGGDRDDDPDWTDDPDRQSGDWFDRVDFAPGHDRT